MYQVEVDQHDETGMPFVIRDESGTAVARVRVSEDAEEIAALLNFAARAMEDFPGLINGEDEVDGGDLVELWNDLLEARGSLRCGYRLARTRT